jgi:hypothetical protein
VKLALCRASVHLPGNRELEPRMGHRSELHADYALWIEHASAIREEALS